MKKLLLMLLLAVLMFGATANAKGDETPAWLKQAAALSVPIYEKKANAVVLVDESRKVVEEDGRIMTYDQYAVRILSREGRGFARASASYNSDTRKVKEIRAWLIRPSGEIVKYDKKETQDKAAVDNDVYNDVRIKSISAADDVEAGSVFGYEIVSEAKTIFSQFVWYFQGSPMPVISSKLTIVMPAGWRAESVTFNHSKFEPVINGTSFQWEARNLPFIVTEPNAPEIGNLIPRIAVSIFPPEGKPTMLRPFASWKDVSRFTCELADPQATVTQEIAAKARELTLGSKTEYEKIQAIGRYAQSVNYISIQVGMGRGGGYRPHAAADVYAKNYGDCKDKANLMRTMLKSINIESFPVSIFSGDPTYVREEWPSPQQFNHAIIAVRVGEETKAPAVLDHTSLGRLLIFDPTDSDTPVGDLPDHEQGSFALIAAGERGELARMPVTEPEANKRDCEIQASLDADGALTARVEERYIGHSAVASRREFKHYTRPDFVKVIERWVSSTVPSAAVSKIEPADDQNAGKFQLLVEFQSPAYAKSMRGNLIVFKPAIVGRRDLAPLNEEARRHPVVLEAQAYTETVRIKLPAGFVVDELPDSAELTLPFAQYAAKFEVQEGLLVFKRSLTLKSATIPVEKYSEVRSFFGRIRAIEQAPVVLAKK